MSEGIFSPVLTDIMVMLSLIVSVMAFIFAAYAWSMLTGSKREFKKLYGVVGEYEKMKERLKGMEKRLRVEEIKLEATVAANRLSRAGLVLNKDSGEADMEAVKKAAEEAAAAEEEAKKAKQEASSEGEQGTGEAKGGAAPAGDAQGAEPKQAGAEENAPPWKQFVDDYNNLAASMDVPRAMQACENFVKTHNLATLIYYERDKVTDQMKFVMVKEVHQSVYWAKMVPGETGRYVVVPNPLATYNNDLHENGGMKETFASNYEKGGLYRQYQVKLPAMFKATLGNWRVDKPGLLRLS